MRYGVPSLSGDKHGTGPVLTVKPIFLQTPRAGCEGKHKAAITQQVKSKHKLKDSSFFLGAMSCGTATPRLLQGSGALPLASQAGAPQQRLHSSCCFFWLKGWPSHISPHALKSGRKMLQVEQCISGGDTHTGARSFCACLCLIHHRRGC